MNSNNLHLGENLVDMSLVIGRDYLGYQERVKLTGLTAEKKWDAFEKAKEQIEICGFYPNYKVVKEMPQSVFADRFGYDMQYDIYHCMTDFYTGKISQSDVKDYLEECCVSMRIYRTQQRQTSGYNEVDNQQIVG
ncbi:MAG: hypothetical protein K2M22_08105, partial [Lachnospiraceae bacterium]|nr:hypothetical protein [Lachnospiraceae bacterium]